jgi:hypothetical protein
MNEAKQLMSKEPKQGNQPGDQPPGVREMLDEIHKRNSDKTEVAKPKGQPGTPEVGIFWEVNGALILDGVPLGAAEAWGQFKNYPGSHEKMWRRYQRVDSALKEIAYDAPPRGRVVYDAVARRFYLYADVCILRNEALVAKIRGGLHLPPEVAAGPDDHYRCANCLAALPGDNDE